MAEYVWSRIRDKIFVARTEDNWKLTMTRSRAFKLIAENSKSGEIVNIQYTPSTGHIENYGDLKNYSFLNPNAVDGLTPSFTDAYRTMALWTIGQERN